MDALNLNRYTMRPPVQQCVDNHCTPWSTLPVVTSLMNERDTLLAEIKNNIQPSEAASTGLAVSKKDLKRHIVEKASHTEHLADYSITEAQLTELSTSVDDFSALIGQPRQRRSAALTANRAAEEGIADAVNLLNDKMDNLVLLFKESHPAFYSDYEAARAIVDH